MEKILNLKSWDRQMDETSKAWAAFLLYRDAPPNERGLKEVGQKLKISVGTVGKWSAKFCWLERVREFDSFIDRESTQKERIESERKKFEMLSRHTTVVVHVQNRAVERFLAITNSEWDKIPIHQLTDIFLNSARFERLSRGLPSDSIELEAATPERFKQKAITEGRLFLKEILHDFPNLPEKKCLEIICAEFDVSASDLGYDRDELDLLDEKMRLTVADEYPEEFEN